MFHSFFLNLSGQIHFLSMSAQIFQRMFDSLIGHKVVVELKNELVLKGTLENCDSLMNFKLIDIEILNRQAFPQLPKISKATIRGSSICYVNLPPDAINLERLHQMSREQKLLRNRKPGR